MKPRGPRVALRVDATRAMGWGHLKRCLALADALREQGAETVFVMRSSDVDGAALVSAAGHASRVLPAVGAAAAHPADPEIKDPPHAHWLAGSALQDAADTAAVLLSLAPAVVLVDHYALDARWHRALRNAMSRNGSLPPVLAAIDDLADRELDVALLIDHNPAADHRAKYAAVLPSAARLLGGPSYALIDPVYRQQPARPWSEKVQNIGIFMGGSDPADHSRWVLQALRHDVGWSGPVQLASTTSNAHLAALQRDFAGDAGIQWCLNQPHLAAFHAGHDLQIGAGGGALWERCALGVPTVALVTAPNQRLSVPLLDHAGVLLGVEAVDRSPAQRTELAARVRHLLQYPQARAALRDRSLALVDGRGAQRAATALLGLVLTSKGHCNELPPALAA